MGARSLKQLQLQMEAWITSRSKMKPLKKTISQHIHSSATLSADKRIEIYQRMYWTRMSEVIADDFPVIKKCLDPNIFQDLCQQYVQDQPSESYTLNTYGDKFPSFIASNACDIPLKTAWHDLAKFEWALKEVFHSPRPKKPNVIPMREQPSPDIMTLSFQPSASMQTLLTSHKVSEPIGMFHNNKSLKGFTPKLFNERIVIYRAHDRSVFQVLDTPTWSFLHALINGQNIESAIEEISPNLEKDDDCTTILSHLKSWMNHQVLLPKT